MITIILVILFGTFTTINTANSPPCKNNSNCQCSLSTLDDIKMDYVDNIGIKIVVDVLSWNGLEVVCKGSKQLEDFNYLSKPLGKAINSLSIRSCILSNVTSLERFVKKLGVLKTIAFSFQSFKTNNSLLTREHLKGVSIVKELVLSHNSLSNISLEFFVDFPKLEKLDLSHNNLTLLNDIFESTPHLKYVDFYNNSIHSMSSSLFYKLNYLEYLDLGYNRFGNMHGSAFDKQLLLKSLSLKANRMDDVPWDLFKKSKELETIDISCNSFETIPAQLFDYNKNLRRVLIHDNAISLINLPDYLLANLEKLEEVNLSNDGFLHLPDNLFWNSLSLKYIYLDNNNFTFLNPSIFQGLKNLEILKLNNNKIQQLGKGMFIDMTTNFGFESNKFIVDLSYNKINNISITGIESLAINQSRQRDYIVYVDHNPVLCDCHLYDLIRYLYNEMPEYVYNYVQIIATNLTCIYTNATKGEEIEQLDPNTYICPEDEYFKIDTNCPIDCICSLRPRDKTRILDCSNRNLFDFAFDKKRLYFVNSFPVIFNFTWNGLAKIPSLESLRPINLISLLLSNNLISQITIDYFPISLKRLELHNNQISRIDVNVIMQLNSSTLDILTLSGNTFTCDCDAMDLLLFVNVFRFNFVDLNNLRCEHSDLPMYKMKSQSFCAPVSGIQKKIRIGGSVFLIAYFFVVIQYQEMISIILVILFGTSTTISIKSSPCRNCQCSLTSLDNLKMNYDDNMGIEIAVDISAWNGLEVVCNDTQKLEDFNYGSKLPGKTVNLLSIRYCILSNTTSLKEFVNKIGVVETKTLSYQSFKPNNTFLTREHLKGLLNVKELVLSHNSLSNISHDFFVDFTELEKLDLSRNNLKLLFDIFHSNTNLKYLDLHKNFIYAMSSTLFNKLEKLEYLNFGYNQFQYIHASAFNKLVSLKSLSLQANGMSDISWDLFNKLTKLESIDISNNKFVSIPHQLFNENKNLRRVVFDNNIVNMVTLPGKLFSKLENLIEVHLNSDGFLFLPENLFTGLLSLKYISLKNNDITYLKKTIFRGLKNLELLKLNSNVIQKLSNETFIDLEKLKMLDLSMNIIDSIPSGLFESLKCLVELNMEYNRLKYINIETFTSLKNLIIAKFSNNLLDFSSETKQLSPFYSNNLLRDLHLSNNRIQTFLSDWSVNHNLKFLNLSHNNISTILKEDFHFRFESSQLLVDLRYNNLRNIFLHDLEPMVISQTTKRYVMVLIDHNPILCDCHLYDLIRYFQNEMHTSVYNYIEIVAQNLTCIHNDGTMGLTIKELNSSTYICPEDQHFKIDNKCQVNCTCSVRPKDNTRILDCSNMNMSNFLIDEKRVHYVENYSLILNLTGNALTRMPSMEYLQSVNVTHLLLSNNRISEITIDKLPQTLKVLEMHNNSISRVDSKVINMLNPGFLNELTLSGNPFICDCDVEPLLNFVKLYRFNFNDLHKLKCRKKNVPLYKLRFESFCKPVLGLDEDEGLIQERTMKKEI
ncbi:hypothetical protein M0802_011860 [Mischocyttarus mexicanus]|nr:hypothetical protein M0802_011860 [Mischocyttarus mexicanus]